MRIRTTNAVERSFREVRWRVRASIDACLVADEGTEMVWSQYDKRDKDGS